MEVIWVSIAVAPWSTPTGSWRPPIVCPTPMEHRWTWEAFVVTRWHSLFGPTSDSLTKVTTITPWRMISLWSSCPRPPAELTSPLSNWPRRTLALWRARLCVLPDSDWPATMVKSPTSSWRWTWLWAPSRSATDTTDPSMSVRSARHIPLGRERAPAREIPVAHWAMTRVELPTWSVWLHSDPMLAATPMYPRPTPECLPTETGSPKQFPPTNNYESLLFRFEIK